YRLGIDKYETSQCGKEPVKKVVLVRDANVPDHGLTTTATNRPRLIHRSRSVGMQETCACLPDQTPALGDAPDHSYTRSAEPRKRNHVCDDSYLPAATGHTPLRGHHDDWNPPCPVQIRDQRNQADLSPTHDVAMVRHHQHGYGFSHRRHREASSFQRPTSVPRSMVNLTRGTSHNARRWEG